MKKYYSHCRLAYDKDRQELSIKHSYGDKYFYKKRYRDVNLLVDAVLSSKAFLEALVPYAMSESNQRDVAGRLQDGDFNTVSSEFATLPESRNYCGKDCKVSLCVVFTNKEKL